MITSPYFLGLATGIRLRKEYFGGIVFDTNIGTMIDIDREAFIMLSIIQNKNVIKWEELWRHLSDTKGALKSTNLPLLKAHLLKVVGQFLDHGRATGNYQGF